ncbi:MAG: hypothetical protein V1911_01465 [Candidatus Micrarchaeota archaeon]
MHKEMQAHSELKWSEIARQTFEKKIQELHWIDRVLAKSEFSEKDADKIGHGIKKGVRERFQ